jgi:hypothetical protein
MNEDEEDNDDRKSESQTNPSSSRDIDEFAIELGLVCNKCMYVKRYFNFFSYRLIFHLL